jgi:hypothetical protein
VRTKQFLLSVLLCLSHAYVGAGQGSSDDARVAGWRSDLGVWLNALSSQHYVLRQGPLPESLRAAADHWRTSVSTWSDERALAELMRLAAMAGDGHTYVLPFGARRVASRVVPLRFYAFADGLFVIDAAPGSEGYIGARVLTLAGISAEDLLPRIRPFVARDNDMGVLWAGPFLLRFVGYLEALTGHSFPDRVPVRLRNHAGNEVALDLVPEPPPRMRGLPKLIPSRLPGAPLPPSYLRNVDADYWLEPLGATALYVQFNQVQDGPKESVAAFAQRLAGEIAARRPQLLIVDVRHNNGGNLGLLDPFIEILRRFTADQPRGRLVVISGRNTFSAAQVFLSRAEHEAHAEAAGEMSSSKPNFVGEENVVELPWSGAIASISNRFHETIPGDRRTGIEPTLRVSLASEDYFANRDPVLAAVLRGR